MSFSFYMVDAAYCDYLRKSDPCVPYTMERKSIRPFVGIVFSVHNVRYYAPLISPKSKHLHMKNQIDFLKIKGGEWGAIRLPAAAVILLWTKYYARLMPKKILQMKTNRSI